MRKLLFLLVLLVCSVFAGLKIAEDPGYAIFAYKNWTMEMPLWFVAFSMFLGLVIVYSIIRFFDAVDASWLGWKNWLRIRRKHKAHSKTNSGVVELIEGNWKHAEHLFVSGMDQSEAPLINFLGAAKAAHEQQAYDKRDLYLQRAADLAPQSQMAVNLLQAQMLMQQGHLEEAYQNLQNLQARYSKHAAVVKLLERVCVHMGRWEAVLALFPAMRKLKIATDQELILLEAKMYQEILQTPNKFPAVTMLMDYWHALPKRLQKNPDLVCVYVTQLQRYPDTLPEIEEWVVKTLNQAWHKELMKLYGQLTLADSAKQLKIAEGWQKRFSQHAMMYLTLARLSQRCQLWGKAKHCYEESIKLAPTADTYMEYGSLLLQLNDFTEAMQAYRDGLQNC